MAEDQLIVIVNAAFVIWGIISDPADLQSLNMPVVKGQVYLVPMPGKWNPWVAGIERICRKTDVPKVAGAGRTPVVTPFL